MSALIQQSDEWLQMRKSKIGASDAPCIMGVGFKSRFELWLEKVGVVNNTYKSSAMQRGLDMEEAARNQFEKDNDLCVFPKVVIHPEYDFMMASLDGMSICGQEIVEIKCPGKEDHLTATKGLVPDKYIPQLMHQMEVCQIDKVYYYSFDGTKGVTLVVPRDDKYIEDMLQEEKLFYECMQNFTAPELTERDYQKKTDDIWLETELELFNIRELLKTLGVREKDLIETLTSMADGRNCIGELFKVARIARKGTVDYSSIPQLQGIDLDKYRKKPSEYWKLTAI